ncbi:MAG: TolC family protein [Anaeromyxobacter sp.]
MPWTTAAALALSGAGCSWAAPERYVRDAAPPPDQVARQAAAAGRAPFLEPPAAPAPAPAPEPHTLADLIDLALAHDPTTRAAWYDARVAAAVAGGARSAYLPAVEGGVGAERARSGGGVGREPSEGSTLGLSGSVTWVLFDMGARGALIDSADAALAAARLSEHAAVADLVLRVQQTHFQYLGALALVDAQTSSVKVAEASLAAAEARRRAGVATVADVLQARTALSQAQLTLQLVEGQALALRGALATLAGLSPTAALDVGALPTELPRTEAEPTIDALLATAAERNPDLGQARASAEAAEARARAAGRAWLPVLSAQGSAAQTWYLTPEDDPQTTWAFGLSLRLPLFEGLRPAYEVQAARASARASRERAEAARQDVALSVWTSYQAFRSAGRRVETARALLESATASTDLAQGRYREGVGSILDLLNAQSALALARAEDVRARADYLVSLAQLARATGRLHLPDGPPPAAPESAP